MPTWAPQVLRNHHPKPIDDEQQPAEDYEVGYCRPPRATRFKPGRSGNPKGRPKGALGINSLARKLLLTPVKVRTPQGLQRISTIEALLRKSIEMAGKGDLRAIARCVDLYSAAVPNEVPPGASAPAEVPLAPSEQSIMDMMLDMAREAGTDRPDRKGGAS
jgi:hypothetical protein